MRGAETSVLNAEGRAVRKIEVDDGSVVATGDDQRNRRDWTTGWDYGEIIRHAIQFVYAEDFGNWNDWLVLSFVDYAQAVGRIRVGYDLFLECVGHVGVADGGAPANIFILTQNDEGHTGDAAATDVERSG